MGWLDENGRDSCSSGVKADSIRQFTEGSITYVLSVVSSAPLSTW